MKTIIFFRLTLIFSLQYSYIYAAEPVATKTVTAVAQTVLGKTVEGLAVANVAMKTYRIGQEIRKHNFPTIKEKVHAEKIAEKFALLTAENELQKCLIANRRTEAINNFGLPIACEDIAQMFSTLGGGNEVNRMTTIFNQYKI